MVKYIFIKSPDEWATTKQACRDKRVVRLNLFLYLILRSTHMYWALFYGNQPYTYIYFSFSLPVKSLAEPVARPQFAAVLWRYGDSSSQSGFRVLLIMPDTAL